MVNRGALAGMEGMEQLSRQEMLGMLKFGCDRIFQVRWGMCRTGGVVLPLRGRLARNPCSIATRQSRLLAGLSWAHVQVEPVTRAGCSMVNHHARPSTDGGRAAANRRRAGRHHQPQQQQGGGSGGSRGGRQGEGRRRCVMQQPWRRTCM